MNTTLRNCWAKKSALDFHLSLSLSLSAAISDQLLTLLSCAVCRYDQTNSTFIVAVLLPTSASQIIGTKRGVSDPIRFFNT